MNDWSDPVDQLVISVSIFFELLRLVSEQPKDFIGGTTAFDLIGEVVLREVDSRLLGVVLQCVIEDK